MTVIKLKKVGRQILDFSVGKHSKNKIRQALRSCEISAFKTGGDSNEIIHYTNTIKIGMYTIFLCLPHDSPSNWNRLRQFRDFMIGIYDPNLIDITKDSRFKDQYWVSKNRFGQLHIKHLIDIIAYCQRLHRLRAFL